MFFSSPSFYPLSSQVSFRYRLCQVIIPTKFSM
uniref:Uncharacterized protein n=1 Tax=Anguilla anguilla TaxID=7936 RepID=A0A0E9XUH5_ANGAN